MTQRIIYTNEEGGVSVVVPAPNTGLSIQAIAEKDCPAGSDYEIVDVSEVPSDRTFRGAWRKGASKVDTDFPAAKEIAHDCRRCERTKEYVEADGDNMYVTVNAVGQAKRDAIKVKYDQVQLDLDAAPDIASLKNVMVTEGLV